MPFPCIRVVETQIFIDFVFMEPIPQESVSPNTEGA
jgi:hypothetical protein